MVVSDPSKLTVRIGSLINDRALGYGILCGKSCGRRGLLFDRLTDASVSFKRMTILCPSRPTTRALGIEGIGLLSR